MFLASYKMGTLAGQWGCFGPWLPIAGTSVKPPQKMAFFEKIMPFVTWRKWAGV